MFNISVIITVYNDACYLSKALNSVESQSIKPREVIVIDDASAVIELSIMSAIAEFKSYPILIKVLI